MVCKLLRIVCVCLWGKKRKCYHAKTDKCLDLFLVFSALLVCGKNVLESTGLSLIVW